MKLIILSNALEYWELVVAPPQAVVYTHLSRGSKLHSFQSWESE
ncbi:hypothetical protein [Paenibacillus phytorum]|nr:hypothetical protein [Paenibacillus phytorum]